MNIIRDIQEYERRRRQTIKTKAIVFSVGLIMFITAVIFV